MRIIALGAVLSLVGNMLAVMSIDAANRIAAQAVTVPNPVNPKLGNVPVANPGFAPITGSSLQPGLSSGDASGVVPVAPGGLNPAFPSPPTTSSGVVTNSLTLPGTTLTSTQLAELSQLGGTFGGSYGGYVGGNFASTAGEGYLNGAANLVRTRHVAE